MTQRVTKENISIPRFLSKTGRRKTKMKKCTALSWANAIDITEEEFDRYLERLGYQFRNNNTLQWERTPKAVDHSKVFLRRIYWDIDVCYEVLKLRGKINGTYFYCEKCGAYNKTENDSDRVCTICGVSREGISDNRIDTSLDWWQKIKEGVRLEKNLSEITYDTWIRPLQYRIIEDRVFVEAPFEEMAIGYLRQHYRECFKAIIRKETGKNYIVSFVHPGEILIEDE